MSNLNKLSFKKSKIKTQEVDYLVAVDSEIWKEYFNKQDLTESDILSTLIREDKIAICGYSFVRILQLYFDSCFSKIHCLWAFLSVNEDVGTTFSSKFSLSFRR